MPVYQTRMINSKIDVTDDGVFHESVDAASDAAIIAAADIAKDLLESGEKLPQIEVVISEGEDVVARHLVTLSVTRVPEEGVEP